MKLIIDIPDEHYRNVCKRAEYFGKRSIMLAPHEKAIANGTPLKDKFIEFKKDFSSRYGLTDDFMVQKSSILWLIDRYMEGKENEYDEE